MRQILEEEIQDELGHAAYLMDVIADMDGEPTTTPQTFDKPEGLKAMLELDLEMEKQDGDGVSPGLARLCTKLDK